MVSFVTPWLFGAAVVVSVVVVGLHLLSVRTPPPMMLPTARFVPDGDARAVARQPRLNDILLLLLRMGAVLAIGAALAGIRWQRTTASELRLVVADERLAADRVWRDSVTRALTAAGRLVDVSGARGATREAGAAMVVALRRAGELTTRYPTISRVDLTVVLPAASASLSGYEAWRAEWPGRVRVLSRGASPRSSRDTGASYVEVRGAGRNDVVASVFTGPVATGATTAVTSTARRVVVERGDALDAVTRGSDVRVHWPVGGIPAGWRVRSPVDTVGAIVANGAALVGPFVRTARPPDGLDAPIDSGTVGAALQVLAWWSDGEPAALERATANGGCVREVAVVLPRSGDLLSSSPARGLLDALASACGSTMRSSRTLATRAGGRTARGRDETSDALAPARAFRVERDAPSLSDPWWLAPLLLALAMGALVAEWWFRRREADA